MIQKKNILIILMSTLFFSIRVTASQPVFDEMPRWKDGWGFQIIEEYRFSNVFYSQDNKPNKMEESIHLLHMEGVYTWDKSIRITVKLPYVLDAVREIPENNILKKQYDRGLGDLTIALPLKRYFNLDRRTGSWTLGPQVKVPLWEKEDYAIYEHYFGSGLGLGYETETYDYHIGISATPWTYFGKKENELYLNGSFGLNFIMGEQSGHFKIKNSFYIKQKGDFSYSMGPTLYMRFSDLLHAQLEFKRTLLEARTNDHGKTNIVRLGLGLVY